MKKLALLTLSTLIGACDSTGPVPVAEVDILLNAVSVDERTLLVGETVQLTTDLKDRDGNALTGRTVTWQSSLPSVATVSDAGLVTAVAAGETIVTASAEGVSDSVLIIVQAPPPELTCENDPGLSLAVGEAHTATAQGSPVFCIAGGSLGSEYVLVPFNAAEASNLLQVEVAGSGLVASVGPPNPSMMTSSSGASGSGARVPPLREDVGFHRRLKERERRELSGLVRGRGGLTPVYSQAPTGAPTFAVVPGLGDTLRFNVNANDACSNAKYRGAVVMAVSERAVIVADTSNPSGGFTQAEYAAFGATYDTLVYPTVASNFGTPSDIDDNGARSVILFTRAVNELTPANSQSFVGGFFFSRDLFPKVANDSMGACPTSNEAEMFYMLVPDPNGEVNNNVRTKEFVAERTVGVLAHEFQHLINSSRRLFVVKAGGSSWIEETWLNEGLSHIAEELTFYAATRFEPRQNIDIEDLRADSEAFDRWVQYQWANFGRYIEYLKEPGRQSALGFDASDNDLATRGAIWAFLRYAADRKGQAEPTLWKSMVDTDKSGLDNLNAAFNNQTFDWLRAWTTSVYTDDAAPTTAEYQQPSWNYRDIITSLRNANTGTLLYPTYPLKTAQLQSGTSNQQQVELQGGGAAYLRFGVPAGSKGAVRATSGGMTAPARLQVTIVRTK
jgi:hypothetical protein